MATNACQALQVASVVRNEPICREHLRLTLRVPDLPEARPGQFVHLRPAGAASSSVSAREAARAEARGSECDFERPSDAEATGDLGDWSASGPLLRRAFSVAGLRRAPDNAQLDVIYRVVGRGTRWLAGLEPGDAVSVLGPVGNSFPLSESRPRAWLVAGGVGLPPMLWLAEVARRVSKEVVAFCGAQTCELLPLTLDDNHPPHVEGRDATLSAVEFARHEVPVVVSTDDGSYGFHGQVGRALSAYAEAHPVNANELVVYACGPEPMMRFVAEFCAERSVTCYVCLERAMACGTGLCQSCVVPVHAEADIEGWRYALCCQEGPVFDAGDVIWDDPQAR